jgi:uncharacterized membrane protein YjjP (DUF1212 family)
MRSERVSLITDLAAGLRRYGGTAGEVEGAAARAVAALGADLDVHVLPTNLTLVARDTGRTWLVSETPRGERLDVREALLGVVDGLQAGRLDVRAARAAVSAALTAPPRYGPWVRLAASAGASAATALLLGGRAVDALLAGAMGWALDVADGWLGASDARRESLGAALSAAAVMLAVHALPPVATGPVVLGALVGWMPGQRATAALGELASGHRSSGTASLMAAWVTLLQLGVGVAAGAGLGAALLGPLPASVVPHPPELGVALAVIAAFALSAAVVFGARLRDGGWAVVGCLAAFAGAMVGERVLGSAVGGGLGAFALANVGAAFSAWTRRPAGVVVTPGLLLLVPGTVGFRAVQALLGEDVTAGVGGAFEMVMAAMALVVGHEAGMAWVATLERAGVGASVPKTAPAPAPRGAAAPHAA